MLNNATGFERIYIACGLSPSYFYPQLLEKSLYINAFFPKDEDNIYRNPQSLASSLSSASHSAVSSGQSAVVADMASRSISTEGVA